MTRLVNTNLLHHRLLRLLRLSRGIPCRLDSLDLATNLNLLDRRSRLNLYTRGGVHTLGLVIDAPASQDERTK